VYGNAEHRRALRRRREWFAKMTSAYAALWWVSRGHGTHPRGLDLPRLSERR
jgi:hypothetical protein